MHKLLNNLYRIIIHPRGDGVEFVLAMGSPGVNKKGAHLHCMGNPNELTGKILHWQLHWSVHLLHKTIIIYYISTI